MNSTHYYTALPMTPAKATIESQNVLNSRELSGNNNKAKLMSNEFDWNQHSIKSH